MASTVDTDSTLFVSSLDLNIVGSPCVETTLVQDRGIPVARSKLGDGLKCD